LPGNKTTSSGPAPTFGRPPAWAQKAEYVAARQAIEDINGLDEYYGIEESTLESRNIGSFPEWHAPAVKNMPEAMDELLAIIAVRPATRNRFLDFVYNGNHPFAYKIDGQSAGAAEGLTVCYQPSDLSADFLAAVRTGEGKLDGHGDIGHRAPPGRANRAGKKSPARGRAQ
jgi:hypothetical protein